MADVGKMLFDVDSKDGYMQKYGGEKVLRYRRKEYFWRLWEWFYEQVGTE